MTKKAKKQQQKKNEKKNCLPNFFVEPLGSPPIPESSFQSVTYLVE